MSEKGLSQSSPFTFLRHSILLLFGVIVSQGIPVLATPFLARLYPPEAFAHQSIFLSTATFVATVATLRLELAVVLAKDEKSYKDLLFTIGICSSIFLILLILISPLIDFYSTLPSLLVYLIPPFMALYIIAEVSNQILNRDRRYKTLTQNTMVGSLAATAGKFAFVQSLSFGLVYGIVIGKGIQVLAIIKALRKTIHELISHKLNSKADVLETLKKFKQFPYFNLPLSLLATVSDVMLILILTSFGYATEAGLIALLKSVIDTPQGALTLSLGRVALKEASINVHSESFKNLFSKIMILLSATAAPIFGVCAFFSEELCSLILGKLGENIALFAVLIGLIGFLKLFSGWTARIYESLNRQNISFTLQIFFDVLTFTASIITISYTNNPVLTLVSYISCQFLFNFTYVAVICRLVMGSHRLMILISWMCLLLISGVYSGLNLL